MRIALDLMFVAHGDGDYPTLVLGDAHGNSVELYVHGDPRTAFLNASKLGFELTVLQRRLPPVKDYQPFEHNSSKRWPTT